MTSKATKYRRSKNGLPMQIYSRQVNRAKKRPWLTPNYSSQKLREWMWKQPKYHKMYDEWVNSNYRVDIRPTIDRVDPMKKYSLNNIQILTYAENSRKGNIELIKTKGVGVQQFDLGGNLVAKYDSIIEAASVNQINASNICNACKGRLKTYKMYIWRYTNHGNQS